jgi:hypothetical protein
LAGAIFSPTEGLLIRNGTGMLEATTEIVDISERRAIGTNYLDGIESIGCGAIPELAFVVVSPTPGGAANNGTATVATCRNRSYTG